jgi:hypothetical protein
MSKADKHEHPDLNSKDTYLCLIDGEYFAGKFSRQWYGWNFDGCYSSGCQFDAPGSNASRWQKIWKISGPKLKKVKLPEEKCQIENCTGRLKILGTCYGDPEGIRSDSRCSKCGQIYGCSKSSLFKMTKEQYSTGDGISSFD